MVAGVLVFGAAAWGLTVMKGAGMAPDLVTGYEFFVWGGLGLLFLVLFAGVVGLRSRWDVAEDASTKQTVNIMGWAVAETGGLVGCVYFLLVGDPTFFGVGLALLILTTFVLLPIPSGATV